MFTKIDGDQLKDGSISNAKISSSAAVDPHKIASSLGNADLYADLNSVGGDASSKVSKSGDTMTGPLILSGDPTTALQAATKQYIDNNFLELIGGTLTGPLILNGDPTTALQAATRQYADNNFLPLTGGTLTGGLILNDDPAAALGAATKQYVDAAISTVVGAVNAVGSFSGFEMQYINGTSFLIKKGQCAADDDSAFISFNSNVTVDTTTVGADGLDTGVISNNTWYVVWAIFDSTDNINSALISLSNSSPTLPPNYDKKRIIGSIYIDSTGMIAYFTQTVASNVKVTHLNPLDITGTSGVYDLYSTGKLPNSATSALIDVAIDNTSTAPSTIVVSEIIDISGPTLLTRKTTYGVGNAGEFWVKLLTGQLYLTGSINSAPTHIPVINVVGYSEQF